MLTNVMIRPFVAYLGESDKTWYVVAQSDGDDSFENYVCLDTTLLGFQRLLYVSRPS